MFIVFFLWLLLKTNSIVISPNEILQVVNEFVLKQIPLSKEDYSIEYRNALSSVSVLKENYTIKVIPDRTIILRGNITIPVEIESDGTLLKRVLCSIKIRTFENVCSPIRRISKGEILHDDDIIIRHIETTNLSVPFFSLKSDCVYKRATKNLLPGTSLMKDMIENIPIIERGKSVKVVSQLKGISVSTSGKAEQDGGEGDIISVRLLNSRDIVKAKVLDNSSVLIIQ